MKTLQYYFKKAQKEGWAVGQFNFSTLEQARGIVAAAKNLNSPVILGTSEGESKFFGSEEAVALRNVLRKTLRLSSGQELPIFLNLDHGKSFEYLKKAIGAGYDMVHFDGSKLALEENIKITNKIKKYARWKNLFAGRQILVEGEIGEIGTEASKVYAGKFEAKNEDLTNPEEAKEYLKKTKVDLLAISIGNLHGMSDSGQESRLRLERLEQITKALDKKIFVLHGGSGTSENDIKEAIKLGVVKININTELRLAFTDSLRQELSAKSGEITPYKYLPRAIESVKLVVEEKIRLFGGENKA